MDHVTPQLKELHWLTIDAQIDFKLLFLLIAVFFAWHPPTLLS
jgi:hypothetical protein